MRFNDGYWLIKDGVKPYYGLQLVKSVEIDDSLHLQVSSKPIRHRGDTLAGPVFDVKFHSPTEGIIGVRITHFKGIRPVTPEIPLFPNATPEPSNVSISIGENPSISTGGLTAAINPKPYSFTFSANNRVITTCHPKSQFIADVAHRWTTTSASSTTCLANDISANPYRTPEPATVRYIAQEFNVSPGEKFYGFGEQFGAFVKNGQRIDIWNQDGGTASEQAYKCVPFYFSTAGYGLFVNHPGEVEFEVGSEKVSRVAISIRGEQLEYFFISGSTPLEVLSRYTLLTGRPALPPLWTFGLWLSTSFLTDYGTETVTGFLEGMKQRNCDVRVFHLDCFWMKQYEWCSFTFDPENFPNPAEYLSSIKEKYGVKICLWINPYISQFSPLFDEAAREGYFIKRTNGDVWQWDLWQPGLAIVDMTNPAARQWYKSKLVALMDLGVDSFKTDFAERIPHMNIKYHEDKYDSYAMHNMYTIMYNQLVHETLEERYGKGGAVVFARSSFAGGQRFPTHWGGDVESTFEGMAETLRGGLSLTLSGFAFTSHDIGGFEGTPPAHVYIRWLAYGLFSSHSRLHGSESYRVPWVYGEEAARILAKYLNAKHRLMPYIYAQAIAAHRLGYPIQRAMLVDFIDDRTAHCLDQQYMLGPSLLFAPVFGDDNHETEYYLPAGTWTAYTPLLGSGKPRVVRGPRWVKEVVPLSEIPAYVRAGSVLALGPSDMKKPDYNLAEDVELRLYHPELGKTVACEIPSGHGAEIAATVTVTSDESQVVVKVVQGSLGGWGVRLFEDPTLKIDGVVGATLDGSGEECVNHGGILFRADSGVTEVIIRRTINPVTV
ncbi:hypothetical protein FS842_010750 [Serendipita sp. 407]|nr:hypothetical protein FS842_010750 [Serendipita sp. 407]